MAFSDLHEIGDMFACLQVPSPKGMGRVHKARGESREHKVCDDEWARKVRNDPAYLPYANIDNEARKASVDKGARLIDLASARRERKALLRDRLGVKSVMCGCGRLPAGALGVCNRCLTARSAGQGRS